MLAVKSRYETRRFHTGADLKKWTSLDSVPMPGGQTISLSEHDGSYSIRVDGAELMSTRRHASEAKLAELACAHAGKIRGARVLIGGLGFGFTLKAALAALAPDAIVVLVELFEAVITWNRNPAFTLAAAALADPRVTLLQQDVAGVIAESSNRFDSIILDVDNGPDALTSAGNASLYTPAGLTTALAALRRGGCLAIWSAAPASAFEKRMRRAGFKVEVERCRAHATSGGWHTLFLGYRL
jgi:spermidine synthase